MTGMTGLNVRSRLRRGGHAVGAVLAVALLLTACAVDAPGSTADPTPPSCAVPAQPGAEVPEGCVAYDPEAGMRANDMYRQRMDMSDDMRMAGTAFVEPVTTALEELRVAGAPITEDAVRSVLHDAGLTPDGIQIREDYGSVLFGATYTSPSATLASCVFGSVSVEAVTVRVGGLIMDGGCLPAQ